MVEVKGQNAAPVETTRGLCLGDGSGEDGSLGYLNGAIRGCDGLRDDGFNGLTRVRGLRAEGLVEVGLKDPMTGAGFGWDGGGRGAHLPEMLVRGGGGDYGGGWLRLERDRRGDLHNPSGIGLNALWMIGQPVPDEDLEAVDFIRSDEDGKVRARGVEAGADLTADEAAFLRRRRERSEDRRTVCHFAGADGNGRSVGEQYGFKMHDRDVKGREVRAQAPTQTATAVRLKRDDCSGHDGPGWDDKGVSSVDRVE